MKAEFPKISKLDAQIITAFILQGVAIAATGSVGAKAMLEVGKKDAEARRRLGTALLMLGQSVPVKPDQEMSEDVEKMLDGSQDGVAVKNIKRGLALAEQLLKYVMFGKEPDAVPTVTGVASDGTPILEPVEVTVDTANKKQYRLDLTHDELHLVFWAFKMAESVGRDFMGMIEAHTMYDKVRDNDLGEDGMDAFVTKIDHTHAQARIDDGEVNEQGLDLDDDADEQAPPSES